MRTDRVGSKTPVINLRKTGENIARMRKEAGISVRELQVIFGFTNPQSIYSWQNGKSLPSVDNMIILASILGVTIDEIISVDEEDNGSHDNEGYEAENLDLEDFDLEDSGEGVLEEGIIIYSHLLS